jgi:hypothetical protein
VFDSTTQIVPGFLIGVVNGRSFHREGLELTSDLGGQLAIEASADLAGIEQFAAFSAGKAQRGDPTRAGHEADHDIFRAHNSPSVRCSPRASYSYG